MPFNYIIKWRKGNPEKVSVEAYHKYPQTKQEKHTPLFTIGKAEGGGLLVIRHLLERAAQKYPTRKRGNTTYILLSENDPEAYETVYRIGLAVALIAKAETTQEIERTTRYVLNAMPEEIWFWTSKLLDDEINSKALEALAVLSGAIQLAKNAPLPSENKQQNSQKNKGTFWPIVRERMKEKAIQLYLQDHPEAREPPAWSELRKAGYLEIAKNIALKEIGAKKTEETATPSKF